MIVGACLQAIWDGVRGHGQKIVCPSTPLGTLSLSDRLAGSSKMKRTSLTPPLESTGWYPRPDLNRDLRFRKPLLYPVELRGPGTAKDLDISSDKIVPKLYLGTPRSQRSYGAS